MELKMILEEDKIYLIEYIDNKGEHSQRIITNSVKYFTKFYENITTTSKGNKSKQNNFLISAIQIAELKSENLKIETVFRTFKEENITILKEIKINPKLTENDFVDLYNLKFLDDPQFMSSIVGIETLLEKMNKFINFKKIDKENLRIAILQNSPKKIEEYEDLNICF
jgi:hypothetical protein